MLRMFMAADSKAKRTLIGASMIKFSSSLSVIWGSVNIYFFSYLKHHGEVIDSTTNSKLLLYAIIPAILSVMIANPFSRLVGYRNAIRTCAILFILSPMVINWKFNLLIFGIFWMIIPILCFCIAGIPLLNCLWTQFPKDLNKISGLAILMFSLGMIFWNLCFMYMINPDNIRAEIDASGLPIFPEEVANRIFKTSNIIFGMAGVINIVGSFMIHKRQSVLEEPINEDNKEVSEQKVKAQDIISNIERAVSTITTQQPEEKIVTLKQGLMDKRFILVFLISGLLPLYLVYLMQNLKLIYMPIVNDDHFLSYCQAFVTVSAVIGAPFWGYIGDSQGFKLSLLLICILDTFVKLFGIYSIEKWSLALLFLLLGANDRGLLTIIGPGLIGMFGIEMATELIPYKGLALILAYAIAPIFQIMLSSLSHLNLLQIFLGGSVISIILSAYLKFRIHYKEKDPAEEGYELGEMQKEARNDF